MIFFLIVPALAYECSFSLSNGYSVDLSPMINTSPPDYLIIDDYGNTYQANICSELNSNCAGDITGIASVTNSQSPCKILGRQSPLGQLSGPRVDFLDKLNPMNGVSLTYYGGDLCTMIGFVDTQVEYRIKCNPYGGPDVLTRAYALSSCSYIFEFSSKSACPIPPAPVDPNSQPKSRIKSFLALLFVGFLFYLAIGTIYNKLKNEESWIDSIPHKEFWFNLPGMIRDGIGFTICRAKELIRSGNLKYLGNGHIPV
ncbi:unnamed protein product [Blepharisma stoltei]|uniref:Autophagy-related protein 27 n=1 Tax=Blepharisma stoltei TaxID=1481888 RepID=A0AAU9IKR1_9CILI|nr:unnamed protein product [Blepharisma stoltei]